MTEFIADFSHYDGVIGLAQAKAIRSDGIAAVTHKVLEGLGSVDDEAQTALSAFRAAGFELIGAYGVPRSGDGVAEARALIARCDAIEPWWRDCPGWFWQVDLERWAYDAVPASVGRAYADELAKTGRRVVVYASQGQYGDELAGWPYPLWNARYPSSLHAAYRALYPGDNGSGWVTYSGQMPAFWQYASSATIGGLTTCDVSAYRGTYDQLKTLLGGDDMEQTDLVQSPSNPKGTRGNHVGDVVADVGAERDWWYDDPAKPAVCRNPPPAGSRLDLMFKALTSPPAAPVELTDSQMQAIIVGVSAQIGGKLDEVLSRLTAAGQALDG